MHGIQLVQTVSVDLMMLQNFIYKSMVVLKPWKNCCPQMIWI